MVKCQALARVRQHWRTPRSPHIPICVILRNRLSGALRCKRRTGRAW